MIYNTLYIALCGSHERGGLLLIVEAIVTRFFACLVHADALQYLSPCTHGGAALLLCLADALGLLSLLLFAACPLLALHLLAFLTLAALFFFLLSHALGMASQCLGDVVGHIHIAAYCLVLVHHHFKIFGVASCIGVQLLAKFAILAF